MSNYPVIFVKKKRFTALNVLKKLAGVWIVAGKEVYYNQATVTTFSCPMRFDLYPLDAHVCKFKVGSTNLNKERMMFAPPKFSFDANQRSTILDYSVEVRGLNEKDRILPFGDLGDFSLTGVEIIFTRHKLKYMYMYYLPSGK